MLCDHCFQIDGLFTLPVAWASRIFLNILADPSSAAFCSSSVLTVSLMCCLLSTVTSNLL